MCEKLVRVLPLISSIPFLHLLGAACPILLEPLFVCHLYIVLDWVMTVSRLHLLNHAVYGCQVVRIIACRVTFNKTFAVRSLIDHDLFYTLAFEEAFNLGFGLA